MGVDVDETGGHDQAARLNLSLGWPVPGGEARDPVSFYAEVTVKPRIAGAIDNLSVTDHKIVFLFWRLGGGPGGQRQESGQAAQEGSFELQLHKAPNSLTYPRMHW